ncbi:hypothetical protein BRPE64_DCDS01380 (plasmid) [Caballeronia insecticola]|uniref:Uncharacterized protein n=1 Tax=Caballeronia insecticola TaxID=758793 RepID=R4WR62_9BURK|nr:hypothetical protein BRPE64_DCDS01380 [Caballeronia insecticola]
METNDKRSRRQGHGRSKKRSLMNIAPAAPQRDLRASPITE